MLPSDPAATSVDTAATDSPEAAVAQRPLRIGYVCKSYPRFSETFIVNEILAREARGTQVTIASLRPPRDPRFHALLARVQAPVQWIPHGNRSLAAAWDALRALREAGIRPSTDALEALLDEEADIAAQAAMVARWAHEEGVQHLHSHFASVAGRTARLASKLLGLPWTVTAHAKDIFHNDNDPYRLVPVLTDASRVVAVSDMTTDWIRSVAPRAKVTRVYNGMDLDTITWSSPAQRPATVVSVGRLVEKKGMPDLIRAVAAVRERGVDARLEIAGEGPERALIEATIAECGLGDVTALHGPMPQHEVLDLVRGAAVFAAPCVVASDGDRDGLPTVLLESMALGTPVVGTPVAGIPEAVIDGETGLIVGEHDVAALTDALELLLTDAETRERFSIAGRARIEEDFDVRQQAANLDRVTREVAAERAAATQPGTAAADASAHAADAADTADAADARQPAESLAPAGTGVRA